MGESAAIAGEVAQLERELEELRTRLNEDNTSFSTLEHQVEALRERLSKSGETLQLQELRLKEKRVELAAAQRRERLDSYGEMLDECGAARRRVSEAAAGLLADLETYEREVMGTRTLLADMRAGFGADDERVKQVESALADEARALGGTWEFVTGASAWRLAKRPEADPAPKRAQDNGDMAKDLETRATDGRRSRILEYFKS